MDYGKFKYEQAKREKESRKGAKHSELREVRMRVKIDDHDIDFKARTAAPGAGRARAHMAETAGLSPPLASFILAAPRPTAPSRPRP